MSVSAAEKTNKEVFKDSLAAPGFTKIGKESVPQLTSAQRSALIRRGNELFNAGKIEEAKRIFVTSRYSDGLIRLGDYYLKKNSHLEAFRMYWLAPDRPKIDMLVERMAGVVREWLEESNDA
jgi:hypothetical protein